MECAEENFLTQLVSKPTWGGASLGLLFTNREGLVGDVVVGGCLGHSDHEMIEFSVHGEAKRGPAKPPPWTFGTQTLACSGRWLRGSPGREG